MAKGKTQFSCVEKRIYKGKWRWAVSYLGECIGHGIVKTQAACRVEKDRVKDEFLKKYGTNEEIINSFMASAAGKIVVPSDAIRDMPSGCANLRIIRG